MNSSVTIASSASLPADAHAAHPAVLQPRLLDRSQISKLQADLHQAIHQAPAVIVDLIWLKAIDPNAIDPDLAAVCKNALHLAVRLGKSIAFRGANSKLSLLLAQEQACLRHQNLGQWQPQPDSKFHDFLRDRASWQTEAATIPDGEVIFPRFGLPASRTA